MCDYSLHHVASRPARVGDRIVSTRFANSVTRGFAPEGEPNVAICLLPGTELAFAAEVTYHAAFEFIPRRRAGASVARFRHVNAHNPHAHHDALEFADGRTVLVTRLSEGQCATVLQLPAGQQPGHVAAAPAETVESRRAALLPHGFLG